MLELTVRATIITTKGFGSRGGISLARIALPIYAGDDEVKMIEDSHRVTPTGITYSRKLCNIELSISHTVYRDRNTISVPKRENRRRGDNVDCVVTVQVRAMDGEEGAGARKGRGEASRNKQGVP